MLSSSVGKVGKLKSGNSINQKRFSNPFISSFKNLLIDNLTVGLIESGENWILRASQSFWHDS